MKVIKSKKVLKDMLKTSTYIKAIGRCKLNGNAINVYETESGMYILAYEKNSTETGLCFIFDSIDSYEEYIDDKTAECNNNAQVLDTMLDLMLEY